MILEFGNLPSILSGAHEALRRVRVVRQASSLLLSGELTQDLAHNSSTALVIFREVVVVHSQLDGGALHRRGRNGGVILAGDGLVLLLGRGRLLRHKRQPGVQRDDGGGLALAVERGDGVLGVAQAVGAQGGQGSVVGAYGALLLGRDVQRAAGVDGVCHVRVAQLHGGVVRNVRLLAGESTRAVYVDGVLVAVLLLEVVDELVELVVLFES